MSNLSDALKRFKANRPASPPPQPRSTVPSEVSEASEISEAGEDSEVSKLVMLYQSIFEKGALSDSVTKATRDDFTARWNRLNETKRKALVDQLLERKLMPEIVAKALTIFRGKMIGLI